VHEWTNCGIVIEGSGWDDDMSAFVFKHWHVRAAMCAEGSCIPRRGRVGSHERSTRDPAKAFPFGVQEASECCSVSLAAHRTMAVVDEFGSAIQFEANLPAET
jgi:hypothetical protein